MSVFPSKVNYATGDILTATDMNEIGQAINLLDGAQFAAGKNKIINGDFGINQRNFTSVATSSTFLFDRFLTTITGNGTSTFTPQVFSPGAAPVVGYEGTNYLQNITASQTSADARSVITQRIEDVRTLANQTVTVSFFAKAATGTPKMAIEFSQYTGVGGSGGPNVYAGQVTLSTSWARYSVTVAIPSLAGATIGTSSSLNLNLWYSGGTDFNARTGSLGIQSNTFSLWGVQVEAASTASNFQTATGTKQGELAACQRYYIRYAGSATFAKYGLGYAYSTTNGSIQVSVPVTMRIVPNVLEFSTLALSVESVGASAITSMTINAQSSNQPISVIPVTAAVLTANRPYDLTNNSSASGYVAFSAEL